MRLAGASSVVLLGMAQLEGLNPIFFNTNRNNKHL
jgi:hypothetical protein